MTPADLGKAQLLLTDSYAMDIKRYEEELRQVATRMLHALVVIRENMGTNNFWVYLHDAEERWKRHQ